MFQSCVPTLLIGHLPVNPLETHERKSVLFHWFSAASCLLRPEVVRSNTVGSPLGGAPVKTCHCPAPVDGNRRTGTPVFCVFMIAFCWKLWYCSSGAASNGRRLAPKRGQLLTPDFTEGGDCMVTYSELFQFVMMLTAVIALILQVCNYKKK